MISVINHLKYMLRYELKDEVQKKYMNSDAEGIDAEMLVGVQRCLWGLTTGYTCLLSDDRCTFCVDRRTFCVDRRTLRVDRRTFCVDRRTLRVDRRTLRVDRRTLRVDRRK